MPEWPEPEMLAVYDPPKLRKQAPHRAEPSVEACAREWDTRRLRDADVIAELRGLGIQVWISGADGLHYFALAPERAERELHQRFRPDVPLTYSGASRQGLRVHPFGSWLADGHQLHLFYGLPRNGEQPGGCVMIERDDCVLVSLMILDWLGAETLIGGFVRSHATVTLQTELGQRTVIDCSENRARPHWRTAAAVPLPRPQDL